MIVLLLGDPWGGQELEPSQRSFFRRRRDRDPPGRAGERAIWLREKELPGSLQPMSAPRPPVKYVATDELRQGAQVYRAKGGGG